MSARFHVLLNGPVKVQYLRLTGQGRFSGMLMVGKHWVWIGTPTWARRIADRVRDQFPMFYAIGLHDCDTGGRVYAWFPAFFWNRRQRDRSAAEMHGDGPDTYCRLTLSQYLRLRRDYRERIGGGA